MLPGQAVRRGIELCALPGCAKIDRDVNALDRIVAGPRVSPDIERLGAIVLDAGTRVGEQ